MKSILRWAIRNTPAMNVLMLTIIGVGLAAGYKLRREEFPRFELEIVLVTVPYPGASPDEVERALCQKIEEAVRSIDGIKKVTSVAREGSGSVVIELKSSVSDPQKVLNEIESEVDRIPSFPVLAEKPEIRQLTIRNPTIKVGVVADGNQATDAELQLREITEQVRDDLLLIPEISVANIQGERKYQIDVEISESTLRKYGLSLKDVATRLRMQNLELPGGKINDDSQVFLLRGKHKKLRGSEIAKLPLVTLPNNKTLTVGQLGTVRDEFEDVTSISRINGKPGMAISIEASAQEDVLAMTDAVRKYLKTKQLPAGYHFETWDDRSVAVNDRLDLLKRNGVQGLILVFIVLALFLDLRLSFWVALGIPVSILGACAVLWQSGDTLNMLSMFSFLIALGIVVDDAIVVGENIYAHREQGKSFFKAAVDGTLEVIPSVTTSVATTVLMFVPMFFVTGVMGKFFAVMPLAVIAILVISLIESTFILPCHLAHDHTVHGDRSLAQRVNDWRKTQRGFVTRFVVGPIAVAILALFGFLFYPFRRMAAGVNWVNRGFSRLLDAFIDRLYSPVLRLCVSNPAITIATAIAFLIGSWSLVRSGTVPWVVFPKLDVSQIQATVVFPDGTPANVTEAATKKMESAVTRVNERYERELGHPVVKLTYLLVGQVSSQSPGGASQLTEGSHAGAVFVELVENEKRGVTSQQIIDDWRKEVGAIPGVESLTFGTSGRGPGGRPIEFKLLAPPQHMDQLEAAVAEVKQQLKTYDGVFDQDDDSRPGKWELRLTLKENAKSLGVPLETVASTARAAYFGEEVMRLQRGRHEVKLMVRYPEEERRSLAQFKELRIDTGDGAKRPITELADINIEQGYSEINRVNQMRSITVTADIDESSANARNIVQDLRSGFMPQLLEKYPNVKVRWEGQQEQSTESIQSLMVGFVIALVLMFALLTLEFTSYFQPVIIMAVIPFGMTGALWGHAAMGLPLTLFSVLGLVALTGVVVNDSIVLVDFINHRVQEGMPLQQALQQAGRRRFRPVVLTSATTVAGMLPLLMETSMQAQLLIPMANSLCFGLMLATTLVLILVPTFYSIYGRLVNIEARYSSKEEDDATVPTPTVSSGNGHIYDSGRAQPMPTR